MTFNTFTRFTILLRLQVEMNMGVSRVRVSLGRREEDGNKEKAAAEVHIAQLLSDQCGRTLPSSCKSN